jgi:hypothetical protein
MFFLSYSKMHFKKILSAVLLSITFCFLGCSKAKRSPETHYGRSLVPTTAQEVVAAPDYKLEYTTKGGIQCFVHPVTPELAKSLTVDSPEFRFLVEGNSPFFLIPIRDGKIINLPPEEAAEVMQFNAKRLGEAVKK